MEAEKEEAIKRYNKLSNIILVVKVIAVVALFVYWCFPAIVFLPQVFTIWLDWFRLVLRNIFFIFLLMNALIALIYFKSAGETEPDLYDQYSAAFVRPSPVEYYRVAEVGGCYDDECSNKEESKCSDLVVMEVKSKSYRRTRSEKKVRTTTVEYRRTEAEKVTGRTATWRSEKMDGLSSEEFRMTVETFITQKKKKMLLRQNGVVWQELSDDDVGTSCRFVGGSGSTGSGSYLAISN